ncbi:uncharacterized protein LOC124260789 [Haliotis rubra]|uniref:uncharacterized protein LOC124260789 n=1 Tax=Haliotis rubra TaxID=36100 RepID=UPI001EE4FDC7|nr:uncharacterized protein LOC124260789 [Haliotis rubra]
MTVWLNEAKCFALCSVVVLTVASTDLNLTGGPLPVASRDVLTLSCSRTTKDVPPLLAVRWYRSTKAMFQTAGGQILPDDSNREDYDEVSGRVNVTTNTQTHKVMLHTVSTLDDRSVWRCSVDDYYSNNIRVVVLDPTTDESPGTPSLYLIVGSSVGLVTFIALIVIAVVWMKHSSENPKTTDGYITATLESPENNTDGYITATLESSENNTDGYITATLESPENNTDGYITAKPLWNLPRTIQMDASQPLWNLPRTIQMDTSQPLWNLPRTIQMDTATLE